MRGLIDWGYVRARLASGGRLALELATLAAAVALVTGYLRLP